MTQISRRTLECPHCNRSFSVTYYASINTWMDPNLAKDFLEGRGYIYNCPSCNQSIRLVTPIIINALKGMFNISTGASEKERKELYTQYGLMNEKGEFGTPQEDWLLHQFAKKNAPEDSKLQIRRRDKITEDVQKKLQLYKMNLKENSPLTDTEEIEFEELQRRWEHERKKENSYLHHPKSIEKTSNSSVLFYKLWEDLVQLKSELDKLK